MEWFCVFNTGVCVLQILDEIDLFCHQVELSACGCGSQACPGGREPGSTRVVVRYVPSQRCHHVISEAPHVGMTREQASHDAR